MHTYDILTYMTNVYFGIIMVFAIRPLTMCNCLIISPMCIVYVASVYGCGIIMFMHVLPSTALY